MFVQWNEIYTFGSVGGNVQWQKDVLRFGSIVESQRGDLRQHDTTHFAE